MWVVPLAHWWTRLIIRWTDVFWQTGAVGIRCFERGLLGLGETFFDGGQVVQHPMATITTPGQTEEGHSILPMIMGHANARTGEGARRGQKGEMELGQQERVAVGLIEALAVGTLFAETAAETGKLGIGHA